MLNWAIGIDMYTLMCIKLMPNKNLQYKKTKQNKTKKKKLNHRRDAVFFSLNPIMWYTFLICPITREVKLDHMTELVSARFLHCKVPLSL